MAISRESFAFKLCVFVCLWVGTQPGRAQEPKLPYPGPAISNAEFDRWMSEKSNWGRWGKDDQLGTLNLITDAKRKQALSLAKEGITVSLEHTKVLVRACILYHAG